MKYERWLIPETDDAAVEALMDAGYPYLVSTVLASRGVVTPEQAAAHLDRERSLVYSPFLMRDMDKAVARIDRALTGGETIAVFGDYDVDGITSTCLLTDYLRSRGAGAHAHPPPHRGGLRPRLRCDPRACRAGRHAHRHRGLRHHRRGGDHLCRHARRRSRHHRPPRM